MPPSLSQCPNHSKPFPDLPADVWLYIIQILDEDDEDDKSTVKSLASVNRVLHSVAFPSLFGTLYLRVPDYPFDLCYLKRAIPRIQGINSSPHILNVIRQLSLSNWDIDPLDGEDDEVEPDDYIMDDDDDESIVSELDEETYNFYFESGRLEAKQPETSKLQSNGGRRIVTLISNLPRLHHLKCFNCSFTLEFFSHILHRSNLRSFHIDDRSLLHSNSRKLQVAALTPSLCVFQYTVKSWFNKQDLANVVKLFMYLIGQLTVFSFPLDMIPRLLADNRLPMTLPDLQKLAIYNVYPYQQDSHNDLGCIHRLLSLTPNLRELRIIGNIHSKTPLILSDTTIPHLKALLAPSYIANNIIPGRVLDRIHIITFGPGVFQEDYTAVSPDTKHLVHYGVLDDPKEELSHLVRMFPNAMTVKIVVMRECKQTIQELSDAVLSILPDFRYLKQCMVFGMKSSPSDYNCPPSHCPVGRIDDTRYRSHPTLEDLEILSYHRWIWTPDDGWHLVPSRYAESDENIWCELWNLKVFKL